ncbi:hypothetical protein GLOIN_2v1547003, partial [Rhizophagus irregularis DAOM 181602=DAOM 197198]
MEVNESVSLKERKKLIERQETNKSEPSPSQPIARKQTAKHSIYFDKIPYTPTKKLKVQNENATSQHVKQDIQQEKDNHTNNDELDHMDV